MTCEHRHHEKDSAQAGTAYRCALAVCLPLGLVLCAACGVHVCPDEVAAALELWRAIVGSAVRS